MASKEKEAKGASRAQVEQRWEFPTDGAGEALGLAGDANLMAVGGSKAGAGFVELVDRQGRSMWRYITREPIRHVTISDVGGFVGAGCDDSQVYFFDRRGLLLWRYKCDRKITGVAVSRDGNVLCAGSDDQGVYFFDNRNTPRRFVWKVRLEGVVSAIEMVPSGDNILAGADDGGIYFIDAREGHTAWKAFAKAPVTSVATSKFADVVVAGAADGSVHCFDLGGRLLWERLTAGGITDVSVDNRGAFVAAASKDGSVYLFDQNGDLKWSHAVGSPDSTVEITRNGDLLFAATAEGRLFCFAASGGLVFDVHAPDRPVALDIGSDSETFCVLDGEALRVFETRQVFKSLILSLRDQILKVRQKGADIAKALPFEKQAVSSLKNFDYKGVYEAVAACERELRQAAAKLSQDSEVERAAKDGLASLRAAEAQARGVGLDTARVKTAIEEVAAAVSASKFADAVEKLEASKAALGDLEKRQELADKAKRLQEEAKDAIERARQYPGVSVEEAEMQLTLAKEALEARNFPMATEHAALAHEMVLMARRSSPAAIEAEVQDIRAKVEADQVGEAEAATVEGGLQNAIAFYAGERNWRELGESFELLDTLWSQRAKAKGQPGTASRHALEAAAFAYLDAGDLQRAAKIAEEAMDYKMAAKLLEGLKQPEEARRVLGKLGSEQRARREEMQEGGRKLDDYIGQLVGQHRPLEAAAELLKFERFDEAIGMLEGQSDPASVAFLIRVHFHQGKFKRLLEATAKAEEALLREVDRGHAELLPTLGRLVAGHGVVAEVLGAGEEIDKAHQMEVTFLEEYARRLKAGAQTDRDEDAAATLFYLKAGRRDEVRALAKSKRGAFYDWLRDAEVMIERGNLKGFRKMMELFSRDFVARFYHMGSTLPSLVPPSNAADALDETYPFNIMAQVSHQYRLLADADFIDSIKRKGDDLLAARDFERALPFYREVQERDPFGVVPREDVAARIAGIYFARGKRDDARREVKEMQVNERDVYSRIPSIKGLEEVKVKGEAKAAQAQGAGDGKRCPACGELVPRVAVRCFRCGSPIR